MSDEVMLGKERVNGEVYEYPFQVVDLHGERIGPELDDVPPFLNKQEMDALVQSVTDSPINTVSVADAIRKIPDSDAGRGEIPERAIIACCLCGKEIDNADELKTRFGKFCHKGCDN